MTDVENRQTKYLTIRVVCVFLLSDAETIEIYPGALVGGVRCVYEAAGNLLWLLPRVLGGGGDFL